MGISGVRGSQEMKSRWCLPKSQEGKVKFLLFSHNVPRTTELTGAHHSSPSGWHRFSFLYLRRKKKKKIPLSTPLGNRLLRAGPLCAWPLDGSMSTPFPTPFPRSVTNFLFLASPFPLYRFQLTTLPSPFCLLFLLVFKWEDNQLVENVMQCSQRGCNGKTELAGCFGWGVWLPSTKGNMLAQDAVGFDQARLKYAPLELGLHL